MTVGGYILVYGLFLVTGGRLGDIVGHKRMFLAGLGLFTAASLACGSAPGMGSLIAFRCVQGLSAALFFPQILSVIQTTFEGARRERALALFGVTIGLAAITGQLIGGVLVRADLFGWGWRPIFLVNVPLGLVVIADAVRHVPRDRAGGPALLQHARRRLVPARIRPRVHRDAGPQPAPVAAGPGVRAAAAQGGRGSDRELRPPAAPCRGHTRP
ncbi:MFS transporter [Streptomyces sp. NBC_01340]|uniref:MFS transporter n=1 Tax=Streptomyces sp. NBC_01340 TaxID=2903830 RepID=UPI002E149E87